jgi:type VI secretion system protein ImpA
MDVEALLKPLSDAAPCGPDLEADPLAGVQWGELQFKAEGEKKDGIVQPPRWSELQKEAMAMAGRWKHLRLGVILLECAAQLEGFSGFRDGLQVLRGWCTDFWDTVHPAGEEDDLRDFRPPLIDALRGPAFLFRLSQIPLAQSLGGTFGFGDYESAKNADTADSDAANHARLVLGTFGSSPTSQHQANLAAISEALEHVRAIEDVFDEKFGVGYGVDLADLRDLLSRMIRALEPLASSGGHAPGADAGPATAGGMAVQVSHGAQASFSSGAIASRQSAIAALESVIRYFEQEEPSSPVPYLLRRAQRCVGKSFMELIDELAHDKAQAELILKPADGLEGADQSTEYS